jgi:hypothetical protein
VTRHSNLIEVRISPNLVCARDLRSSQYGPELVALSHARTRQVWSLQKGERSVLRAVQCCTVHVASRDVRSQMCDGLPQGVLTIETVAKILVRLGGVMFSLTTASCLALEVCNVLSVPLKHLFPAGCWTYGFRSRGSLLLRCFGSLWFGIGLGKVRCWSQKANGSTYAQHSSSVALGASSYIPRSDRHLAAVSMEAHTHKRGGELTSLAVNGPRRGSPPRTPLQSALVFSLLAI